MSAAVHRQNRLVSINLSYASAAAFSRVFRLPLASSFDASGSSETSIASRTYGAVARSLSAPRPSWGSSSAAILADLVPRFVVRIGEITPVPHDLAAEPIERRHREFARRQMTQKAFRHSTLTRPLNDSANA